MTGNIYVSKNGLISYDGTYTQFNIPSLVTGLATLEAEDLAEDVVDFVYWIAAGQPVQDEDGYW